MDAVKTCSSVLENIRQTNLNFVFSESPFGVKISIKKSFRKDPGNISDGLVPATAVDKAVQIDQLEDCIKKLKSENFAKETEIKDFKAKNEKQRRELKDADNIIEDSMLREKKTMKQLKEKETHNITKEFERVSEMHKAGIKEVSELKAKLNQEKKDTIKLQKREAKKDVINNNKNDKKSSTSQTDVFKCEICAVVSLSEIESSNHISTIHKNTSTSFSQTEETKPESESFVQYPCFYCGNMISSKTHLSDHISKCSFFVDKNSNSVVERDKFNEVNKSEDPNSVMLNLLSEFQKRTFQKFPCDVCLILQMIYWR